MSKNHQQHKTKRECFPCQGEPEHAKCKKEKYKRSFLDPQGNEVWEVKWAPCRKDEAIKHMRDKYGYTDHRHRGEDNNAGSHHKSHHKSQSKKHRAPPGPSSSQQYKHVQVAGGQHNTPAQAPAHQQYQHHQMQQPTAFPPRAPVLSYGPPAVPSVPMMSSHDAPPDGQRHRRRHHHESSREPGPGPMQDSYPPSTIPPVPSMPAGMVPPMGMTGSPVMTSNQVPSDGQQHHRHRQRPDGHSYHEQVPRPPAGQPPPQSMRESMSIMAEEAMPAHPTQNMALRPAAQAASGMPGPGDMLSPTVAMLQAEGRVTVTGGFNMPPPPPHPTMSEHLAAQNISLLPAAQPGPGMPRLPKMQLLPMGGPQARGTPEPRHAQNASAPGLRSGPHPPPQRTFSGASAAAGTPGPQAMTARLPPGVLSQPSAKPPDPRMQPPPMSMPPFPGTGPGTPMSSGPFVGPPPPAPTPPLYPGTLD